MAYFNLDAVNESVEEVEETSVLDNMLEACEYMLDVLDESKARQKYVENRIKKAEEAEKEADYRDNINKTFSTEKTRHDKDVAEDKARKYLKDAERYADVIYGKYNSAKSLKAQNKENKRNEFLDWLGREKEEDFRDTFKIPKDKYDAKDNSVIGTRKPGGIKKLQDQKRAIKETCLHILSIIDDIE